MDASEWESEARYEQWIPGLALMRDALLTSLSDADLECSLGGTSLTLGQLIDDCAAMQRSYTYAFDELNQTWDPPHTSNEHLPTVAAIRERFVELDRNLASVLDAYDEAEWDAVIQRPDGTKRTRRGQLEIYAQFMLIFLAKLSVYARAWGRQIPPSVVTFVG